jgi:nucleotide-binding universal stress UspA family protein
MHVVVPVAVFENESVSMGLAEFLSTVDVTVLGYHVLPEQTPPDQARAQYEDRANAALDDVMAAFAAAGGDAYHRLVFTHDRQQSIDRVADDAKADAYAIAGVTGDVESLLVPLTGDVDVDRIVAFVAALVGDRDIAVTLFGVAGAAKADSARRGLDDAASTLAAGGVDVSTAFSTTDDPLSALTDAAKVELLGDAALDHDAIVMGERAPSLQSFLFGDESSRVAAEAVGPVLVVRRKPDPTTEQQPELGLDEFADAEEAGETTESADAEELEDESR